MKTTMNDFANACLVVLLSFACVFLGVFIGHLHGTHYTQQNILAQCAKTQFYFFDGVGVMCPSTINNREEQK